jgi:imidazolonepropionase
MARTRIVNIGRLGQVDINPPAFRAGKEMSQWPEIENAYLTIEDDFILEYGFMTDISGYADQEIDAQGGFVLPAFCDPHSHLVFAGSRELEFVDKINGLSYAEIAARGGGILNSAARLQQTSADLLFEQAAVRLEEVMAAGTGAIEIKSGYGLRYEDEIKMLRVIKRLKDTYPVQIKATLLGAHALPNEFKHDRSAWLSVVTEKLIPEVAAEGLADFVDVFCESNYFTVAEMEQIMATGAQFGLPAKVHVNQFTALGGVAAAVKANALSVDHLEIMTAADINALKGSNTMPTVLPSCSFYLRIPYAPAREMIDAGLPVALASDYNPGSSPAGKFPFLLSLACIQQRLLPEEAFNAATLNAAYAMQLSATLGSITPKKKANVIITKHLPSWAFMPYAFGTDHIKHVIVNGKLIR